jgi:hypothetical protein
VARIFFDVDYTILSNFNELRPGTREVWERIVADGHEIHVWSGVGLRHQVLRDHALEDLVSGVYAKPTYNYLFRLETLGVEHMPDFIIDDFPEICTIFGGFHCREFYDELEHIYQAITEWAETGSSAHERFHPRHVNFQGLLDAAAAERAELVARHARIYGPHLRKATPSLEG